jgi:hypothetical protein
MQNNLQENTKKVMSLVVATTLLLAGIFFIFFSPDRGTLWNTSLSFNHSMGAVFMAYGLFRGYLLFTGK